MIKHDYPGKVVKTTPGTFIQAFDQEGNLKEAYFIAANEDIDYECDGEILDYDDDKRTNFYAPFDTINRQAITEQRELIREDLLRILGRMDDDIILDVVYEVVVDRMNILLSGVEG